GAERNHIPPAVQDRTAAVEEQDIVDMRKKTGTGTRIVLEYHAIFGFALDEAGKGFQMAEEAGNFRSAQGAAIIGPRPGVIIGGKSLRRQLRAVDGADAGEFDALRLHCA